MSIDRLIEQVEEGLQRGHYRDPVSGGRLVRNLLLAFRQAREPRRPSEKPAFEDLRRRRDVQVLRNIVVGA